jgi:uncharacterized protein (TIGR02646 family)
MIHVNRTQTPPELDGENSIGGRERARWREYYAGTRKRRPSDFSAYSDDRVRIALIQMFHRKCAYCDSMIAGGDVEHWRPKNAVFSENRAKVADGYWWLAADWQNLLYSCTSCNQVRLCEQEGNPRLVSVGKGCQFPLADESYRAQHPGEETMEEPLLLNPCEDFPEKHLRVAIKGREMGVLQPLVDPESKPDRKAEVTITMFGLNLPKYVTQRQNMIVFLNARQKDIDDIVKSMKANKIPDHVSDCQAKIRRTLGELRRYLKQEQEQMLLVQQEFIPYLKSLGAKVD